MDKERYLYSALASAVGARLNCLGTGTKPTNQEWFDNWTSHIEQLVLEHMPSGSGFNNGTSINLDQSHDDKLVFQLNYQHMGSESGMYDGWTDHKLIVTPSFSHGFHLRITGPNRNGIKEYISDTVCECLRVKADFTINPDR